MARGLAKGKEYQEYRERCQVQTFSICMLSSAYSIKKFMYFDALLGFIIY